MKFALKSLIASALVFGAVVAQAAVARIDEASMLVTAGPITFSEAGFGTTAPLNPVYAAGTFGLTFSVSFGSYFAFQQLGTTCGTAQPSACVVDRVDPVTGLPVPTGPLALATLDESSGAKIFGDSLRSDGVALAGTPQFNGPIAMLFSEDQAAVSFIGGLFNAIGSTLVTAYNRAGEVIGTMSNLTCGFDPADTNPHPPECTSTGGLEFMGIGSSDGSAQIAGILISLVGFDQAGFSIDNVSFGSCAPGSPGCTVPQPPCTPGTPGCTGQVPEPTSLALVGLALLGLGVSRRRRSV